MRKNVFAVVAPPWTPLEKLAVLLKPASRIWEKERNGERKEKNSKYQIKSNHLFSQANTKALTKWIMKELEQGHKGLQEPLLHEPQKKKTYK